MVGCGLLVLVATIILGWDAVANEELSVRSIALAACVAGAGFTFGLLGERTR